MNTAGLVLSDDLLFASQITGFAHDRGAKVRMVRDRVKLFEALTQNQPKCVFIDLHVPDMEMVGLINDLSAMTDRPLLIAFGSHVDAVRLQLAREAGCDLVLPRSAFTARLPAEISFWLDGKLVATESS
jgi:CheY-like chemotaxis protein